MDDLPPRARRARRVLDLLLLAVAASTAWRGAGAVLSPPDPVRPPVPVAVDLARDPPERLRLLPGIGRELAIAIVADRERRGPVRSLGDLARVRGIGPGTVERLRASRGVRALVGGEREEGGR